jgi:antitoxin VapB
MALSIKNEELEERVRRLAALSGESLTGALRLAVDNEISRREGDKEARFQQAMAEIRKIQARVAALPRLNHTTDDDLYDDHGLPR